VLFRGTGLLGSGVQAAERRPGACEDSDEL
jgi:hypothetical protein